jgi:hypothetical protein
MEATNQFNVTTTGGLKMQSQYSVATEGHVWEIKTSNGTAYKASRRFQGVWECDTFRFIDNAKAWAGI